MVRAQSRRIAAPAQRIDVAVQDVHVRPVFHRPDAGDLSRAQRAISDRRLFHQWLAEYRRSRCLSLPELPEGVPRAGRRCAARPHRCDQSPVSQVLRRLHESRPRRVAALAGVGHRGTARIGVRRQSRRRYSNRQEREAPRRGGALVQRGSPGARRRHGDLGLRAAGARRARGDGRPRDHQRHRRVQQQPADMASRGEGAGRDDDVDGADGGERHGTVVPLARRRARRHPMEGSGTRLLRLARGERAALPQHAVGGRRRGPVPAADDCFLSIGQRTEGLARRRARADGGIPARAVLRAARRTLLLRLRSRRRPADGDAQPVSRAADSERGVRIGSALPADSRLRQRRRIAARDVRDLALQRMGRSAIRFRAGRSVRRERRRRHDRSARQQLHADRAAPCDAHRLRRDGAAART